MLSPPGPLISHGPFSKYNLARGSSDYHQEKREKSESVIYNALVRNGPSTKEELHTQTRLSTRTLGKRLRAMQQSGEVMQLRGYRGDRGMVMSVAGLPSRIAYSMTLVGKRRLLKNISDSFELLKGKESLGRFRKRVRHGKPTLLDNKVHGVPKRGLPRTYYILTLLWPYKQRKPLAMPSSDA